MLTVAVSVTSGTEAITSAIPALANYQVLIAVLIVIAIMALNLRGMRESASFLTFPVYFFIIMIIGMILWGVMNIASGNLTYHASAAVGAPVQGMTLVLFLRAFSSGSSSLTGVEAISNAVPNFKRPKRKNAANTLAIMSLVLAVFFGGITYLSYYLGVKTTSRQYRLVTNCYGGLWSRLILLLVTIIDGVNSGRCGKYWFFSLSNFSL